MATSRRSRSDLRSGQTRSRTALNTQSSRPQRGTSLHSVHSVASTSQVRLQLFREAFNFIDQDGDQIISKDDLKSLYESLGVENVSDSQFDEMLSEISGQLNHSKFQCMMASRAGDMDDSQVLLNAFKILDPEGTGRIPIKEFCNQLRTIGYERMTAEEINSMLKIAPVDRSGYLDYKKFVEVIRGATRVESTE